MSNYKEDDDVLKSGKRGKPPVQIYRPGSGPLPRKTGRGEDEMSEPVVQKDQRKFGGGEKPRGPGGGGGVVGGGGGGMPSSKNLMAVSNIIDALSRVQDSRRTNDDGTHSGARDPLKRNRNKKAEPQLYVVKSMQNQQQDSDGMQDKSSRNNNNNNKMNSSKEGGNKPTNMVDRNQSVKVNMSKGSNANASYQDRNQQGMISDDENSNSQSLVSGRNTSDRPRKSKYDKRKRKGKGGGGGGGMRNDSNSQMNGFQDHQSFDEKKTSQSSTRGQDSVTSDNSHTFSDSCSGSNRSLDKRNDYNKQMSRDDNRSYEHVNSVGSDRSIRQTSEPRVMPTGHHYQYDNCNNRSTRDTHSMEHNDSGWNVGYGDKSGGGKPREHGNRKQIGGKHSKTSHHNPVEMAPRFLKKKLMESNMKHIGTTNSEDQWDGNSRIFQGTNTIYPYQTMPSLTGPPAHHPHHHPPPQQPHPSMFRPVLFQHHHHQQVPPGAPVPGLWNAVLQTMPVSRGRGRLRCPQENVNEMDLPRNTGAVTPERLEPRQMYADAEDPHHQNHRYGSSTLQDNYCRDVKYEPHYNDNKVDEFYNTKVNSAHQSADESSPSTVAGPVVSQSDKTASTKNDSDVHSVDELESLPSKNQSASVERLDEASEPNDDDIFKAPTSDSIDWVEEIERTERLQARSDLSRTTSVTSLHETSPRPKESGVRRKRESKRKKRHGSRNEATERSPSRDSSIKQRGSHESLDCQWRRGEKENLSWRANSHERNASGSSRHNSAERWHQKDQRNGNSEWFRGSGGGGSGAGGGAGGGGKHAQPDRRGRYRNGGGSRERRGGDRRNRRGSSELWSTKSSEETNWRNELRPPPPRTVDNTEHATVNNSCNGQKSPGILVLPHSTSLTKTSNSSPRSKSEQAADEHLASGYNKAPANAQRQLFNPSNPNEPIIVAAAGCRVAPPHMMAGPYDTAGTFGHALAHSTMDKFRSVRSPQLLSEIEFCERELGAILSRGQVIQSWSWVMELRYKLQEIQKVLLMTEMNFCQANNIEQHIWKLVFYSIIEFLRKMMTDFPETADRCKELLLSIIQDGMKYYEDLVAMLENCHEMKLEDYLSNPEKGKGLGVKSLVLVSAQKLYLFLGDLARYKDQVNEKEQTQRGGSNYGIARQWYIKAQQLNPKNGRPYNQLAVVSFYGRRKLDAVYYYMRSLMASNPIQSARERLLSMFDENRKKWESMERCRRGEERGGNAADKESLPRGRMRREIWIRPDGGKSVLRTTSASDGRDCDSEEEENELKSLTYVELNKRFGVSFLHVHGKLFTKTGMESFQEAGVAMLREFRVLLQHSPIPLTLVRFLQLLALNMFAIENTQLKNTEYEPGYRSATQECALIVSLQMFNLIVERCVQLLLAMDADNQHQETSISNLTSDVHVLLPAIKVWCDWLLCHSTVWNPPPSCRDYRVGPSGDAWTRLATLVNLLEKFNSYRDYLSTVKLPDFELVRLPEDVTLSGFTPLMCNSLDDRYTNCNCDMDLAQIALRIDKILFFGTEFLCGVDPPVLKLQKYETGVSEYVSVVETPSPPVQSDSEMCIESGESDGEGVGDSDDSGKATGVEEESEPSSSVTLDLTDISNLLQRKEQLERSHRKQERRRQKVQAILRECEVTVEMEVRPHFLVPDTNCLIDYLPELAIIANATSSTNEHLYSLMVPLVVLNELEGLSRGACKGERVPSRKPQHTVLLAEAALNALSFLRSESHPAIKCVTTHGNTLSSNRFTAEKDYSEDMKNDDKILTACLNLSRLNSKETKTQKDDGPRRVFCEVVLLTEDRNLKLKALARDMPVSDMPHFMQWAGLR